MKVLWRKNFTRKTSLAPFDVPVIDKKDGEPHIAKQSRPSVRIFPEPSVERDSAKH